jgi:hypothetical protein
MFLAFFQIYILEHMLRHILGKFCEHACLSFGYDLQNGGPVLQQVKHVKEPSLLKAIIAKHRFKFAPFTSSVKTSQ